MSMFFVFSSKLHISGMCLIFAIICLSFSEVNPTNDKWCHPSEKLDISAGIFDQVTKTIKYNDTIFSESQYKRIDNKTFGCLCKIQPCIRLCCPFGTFIEDRDNGIKCSAEKQENATHFVNQLRNENNVTYDTNHFKYVDDQTCIENPKYERDWIPVTDEGYGIYNGRQLTRREYCFSIFEFGGGIVKHGTIFCKTPNKPHPREMVLPICTFVSLIFTFATILIYLCIPELLNLVGKCVICYLSCWSIHSVLFVILHFDTQPVDGWACKALSYVIYFFAQSTIAWTSVLSFDCWSNFGTTVKMRSCSDKKSLYFYMLYVCVWSSILLIIACIFDAIDDLPNNSKPNFGADVCYINSIDDRWPYIGFYYIPVCIVVAINMTLFILSTVKIIRMQLDLKRSFSIQNTSQPQKSNKGMDKYMIFLRLSIVFGLNWFFEGILLLDDPENDLMFVFDILNNLFGVVFFLLFIVKKRVLKLMMKKWFDADCLSSNNPSDATNDSAPSSGNNNLRSAADNTAL